MILILGELCGYYSKGSVHECRWLLTWPSKIHFSWWKSK